MKHILTHEEMLRAVRAHYGFSSNDEIVIESVEAIEPDWIYVPHDWFFFKPPCEDTAVVCVVFADGSSHTGRCADDWSYNWNQHAGPDARITKYYIISE